MMKNFLFGCIALSLIQLGLQIEQATPLFLFLAGFAIGRLRWSKPWIYR